MSESSDWHNTSQPAGIGGELLCMEPCLYRLTLEVDGSYAMQAEVNRSACFSIRFRLDSHEEAQFKKEGATFAHALALRVDSFPEHFIDRAI